MGTEITEEQGAYLMTKIRARCTEDGDCWLWNDAVNEAGLPRYGKGSARRKIWTTLNGPINGPYFVGCICRERRCLNPEHLVLRTKSSVVKDGHANAIKAQRYLASTLTARKRGKLNDRVAQEIRESDETLGVLAERYGVHLSLIGKVKAGQAWQPLSSPFAGLGAR